MLADTCNGLKPTLVSYTVGIKIATINNLKIFRSILLIMTRKLFRQNYGTARGNVLHMYIMFMILQEGS